MWIVLLDRMLAHVVRHGTLSLTLADGTTRSYGRGRPNTGWC